VSRNDRGRTDAPVVGRPARGPHKTFNHVPRGWLLAAAAVATGGAGLPGRAAGPVAWSIVGRAGRAPAQGSAGELRAAAVALEDKSLEAEAAGPGKNTFSGARRGGSGGDPLPHRQAPHAGRAVWAGIAGAGAGEQAAGDNKELKGKIGPLVVECLSRLGRYGEVGRELAAESMPAVIGSRQGEDVATLSGRSLTDSDLDRLAERRVDGMLAMQGATGDEARRKAILEQLSTPAARKQLLQELLQAELFCRRARELRLDQEEPSASRAMS